MNKKWLIAGVVIAALLVAGTLLMDRGRTAPGPAGSLPATATASGSATTGAPTPASAGATKTAESSESTGRPTPPGSPQDKPVPLEKVTQPPTHTVAFVDAKAYTAGSTYAVTFVPYGTGPSAQTLVIRISESKPNGKVAKPYDFVDHNILVDTSRLTEKTAITKGGRYKGTILLQKQDDILAPMLTDASPTK